jgi:small subunit ribosomal protein S20
MPVIKSAKKKLRIDRKRESINKKEKALIEIAIKMAERKPTPETIRKAFKAIDKSVKKDIYHKNKGARIKSRLAKLLNKKTQSSSKPKVQKTTKKTKK